MSRGIHVMNPYEDPAALGYVRSFLDRYFSDHHKRLFVIGINPGRFGAGITGITFTDPVALSDFCGIENDLPRRREPSSMFVYEVIERLGGPSAFYRRFFLTAVSPLGFTRDGKNLNYYDDARLERAMTPFIVETMERQIALGARRDHALVFGRGENFRFLEKLNAEHNWFGELHPLDHPRPIVQYKRKRLGEYAGRYAELFERLADSPAASSDLATP